MYYIRQAPSYIQIGMTNSVLDQTSSLINYRQIGLTNSVLYQTSSLINYRQIGMTNSVLYQTSSLVYTNRYDQQCTRSDKLPHIFFSQSFCNGNDFLSTTNYQYIYWGNNLTSHAKAHCPQNQLHV